MRRSETGITGRLLFLSLALSLVLSLAVALPTFAQRGDDSERVSKNGRTAGEIDGVAVVVEYGRPKVKGREIWGALVPYAKVWRTGANEATTIRFPANVLVEGEPLPAGRYGLFTIPGEERWTIVFNRVADQWGAFSYDPSEDVLRVEVEPRQHEHVEEMDFVIEGSDLVLRWAELAVPIRIEAAG